MENMTYAVKSAIKEIEEKRKIVKPAEDNFMNIFNKFHDTVKTFVKENKWYGTSNKYVKLANIGFIHIGMIRFNEDGSVSVEYDDYEYGDTITFSANEIGNVTPILEETFTAFVKAKETDEIKSKENRRAALLEALAALDKE